jgi:AcrR family transcriptional regulator
VEAGASERERIMQAAYRRLAVRNGRGVSVTDVLTEAGLSTRAFYRHFASKDDLLLAMFRRDSERVLAELQTMATKAAGPGEALRRWIAGYIRLTTETKRRQHVLVLSSHEAQQAAGYDAEKARFMAAQEAALAHILHRGRDDGSFPWAVPEADARAIRAVLGQAFDDQMTRPASISAAEAVAQVTDFAFRALGAAHPPDLTADTTRRADAPAS